MLYCTHTGSVPDDVSLTISFIFLAHFLDASAVYVVLVNTSCYPRTTVASAVVSSTYSLQSISQFICHQ